MHPPATEAMQLSLVLIKITASSCPCNICTLLSDCDPEKRSIIFRTWHNTKLFPASEPGWWNAKLLVRVTRIFFYNGTISHVLPNMQTLKRYRTLDESLTYNTEVKVGAGGCSKISVWAVSSRNVPNVVSGRWCSTKENLGPSLMQTRRCKILIIRRKAR